jgi:hypothetical protein
MQIIGLVERDVSMTTNAAQKEDCQGGSLLVAQSGRGRSMGIHPNRDASVSSRHSRACSKLLTNEIKGTGRFAFTAFPRHVLQCTANVAHGSLATEPSAAHDEACPLYPQ